MACSRVPGEMVENKIPYQASQHLATLWIFLRCKAGIPYFRVCSERRIIQAAEKVQ